jgi:DNA-binding IclR family transcriptional regulator
MTVAQHAENVPRQDGPTSQTLHRGLQLLELLCASEEALPLNAIATASGLHRSVTYRLVRTLEQHGLALRTQDGYRAGPGLRHLVETAEAPLQRRATPVLQGVVDDLEVTAFLTIPEHDLCVTRACVEARRDGASLVQRPGTAHPLTRGAPGLALLVALGDIMSAEDLAGLAQHRLADVEAARSRGWAYSHDEVIPSLRSVAVPVRGFPGWPAAVAVVYLGEPFDQETAARRLQRAARELGPGSPG